MNKCPCGNPLPYEQCCEPYITGNVQPGTPEILMRARYTAYVKGAIEFIADTHAPDKREDVSLEETRKWAEESEWLGLEILGTKKGGPTDKEGTVEFKATYIRGKIKEVHHEISSFKKVENRWYFDEGKIIPTTIVKVGEDIGRNDPCPCGSGKKYKKCCMK